MEPTAKKQSGEYVPSIEQQQPALQSLPAVLLDRVLGREPLEQVLRTSATLMELHLGLTDCTVRLSDGSQSPASAAGKPLRDLRASDGSLLGTVNASTAQLRDTAAERHLDSVCRVLSHALEHEKLRADLERQARIDSVTGLANRDSFDGAVAAAVPGPLALLWLDLDRFKEVNDSLGHAAGDELLRGVAERVKQVVPADSTVARMGGDEFAVLLPGYSECQAMEIARQLLDGLLPAFRLLDAEVFVTGSIGVVTAPQHGITAAELQQNADTAMYLAKSEGRNGCAVYTASAGEAARKRLELARDLRRGLKQREFELYFQPQVDLQGEIQCFEALVRWRHPVRGLLLPGEFIDIAEETGLIVPLGTWVMEEACRKCALWNATREKPVKVAVNVSALQFYFSDLAQVVRGALERSGLIPSLLEIELTESLLLRDTQKCMEDLASLRTLGISVAIDDFGAGYSCLSYLQRLPVDVIKIDKSFFDQGREERSTTAVVGAITGMAHGLGLQVVAEGIEEPGQMAVLRQLRVDLVQGYLFGRPRPIGDADSV